MFCDKLADNRRMTGMTMQEMADVLGITKYAVKQRLLRAGIKPKTKDALYDESALEVIREAPMGHPSKKPDKPPKTAPKPKK
jgi:predicted ArsR family transcriptional regulator